MAAVQTPADKLLRILTGNRPAPCDLIGTSTTSMKLLGPEAMDVALHPRDYIRADTGNHLYNRLQRDIDSALPFLVFPEQAPDPASGRPGLTWIALENYISQQSILALTENDPYGGEGEAGLLAFLKTYLFDPLNYLIRVTLPHLPGHLKWYTAGVNKAKPDMRLKWIPDHGTDQDVAAVEFKTPFSCPDRIMKDFMEAIKAGNVRVDPDGQSRNGDTHDKGCQILDQVSVANGG